MMVILRDQFWGSVAAIAAIVAICLTLWFSTKQKVKKLLVFEVSLYPLLRVDEALSDEFQIIFRGKSVSSAYVASISLSNKGNSPIARPDFDEKLYIRLTEPGELVSIEPSSGSKIDLVINHSVDNIVVEPFLLNPNEIVKIQAIVVNGCPSMEAKARIIGGKLITVDQLRETRPRWVWPLILSFIGFVLGIIITVLISHFSNTDSVSLGE